MRSWTESPSIPTIVPNSPAAGNYFIAILQGVDHFLGLLLAALRGEDQQHIKNAHDDDQRQERHQAAGAPAWAIKDKLSGEENKDIAATPASRYDQSLDRLPRTKMSPATRNC